jgi:toxin ParE1/3/4
VIVRWSEQAAADLSEIIDYIRRDSPQNARQFATRLLALVATLRDSSARGRPIPEATSEDHRELLFGSYRVMYHLGERRVFVTRIIHAARDPSKLPSKPWDVT